MHFSLSFIINSKIRSDFPVASVVAMQLHNDKKVLVANGFPPPKNACCSSATRFIYGEEKNTRSVWVHPHPSCLFSCRYAWKKNECVASIISALTARLHLNELEREKDAICEVPLGE